MEISHVTLLELSRSDDGSYGIGGIVHSGEIGYSEPAPSELERQQARQIERKQNVTFQDALALIRRRH